MHALLIERVRSLSLSDREEESLMRACVRVEHVCTCTARITLQLLRLQSEGFGPFVRIGRSPSRLGPGGRLPA